MEPWLGDRAAFALVDQGKDQPAPVFVVQIKDQDEAEAGLKKLTACASDATGTGDDLGGYAFNGDWVVLAENEGIAQDVVDAAGDGSLSDDGDYAKWTEAAGDPGIVTMYAAPEAGEALLQLSGFSSSSGYSESSSTATMAPAAYAPVDEETESPQPSEDPNQVPGTQSGNGASPNPSNLPTEQPSDLPSDFSTELPSDFPSDFPSELPSEPDEMPTQLDDPSYDVNPLDNGMNDEMKQMLKDFPGGAMVIRFNDGDLELETAMGSITRRSPKPSTPTAAATWSAPCPTAPRWPTASGSPTAGSRPSSTSSGR